MHAWCTYYAGSCTALGSLGSTCITCVQSGAAENPVLCFMVGSPWNIWTQTISRECLKSRPVICLPMRSVPGCDGPRQLSISSVHSPVSAQQMASKVANLDNCRPMSLGLSIAPMLWHGRRSNRVTFYTNVIAICDYARNWHMCQLYEVQSSASRGYLTLGVTACFLLECCYLIYIRYSAAYSPVGREPMALMLWLDCVI
jgi:hypothetical protein